MARMIDTTHNLVCFDGVLFCRSSISGSIFPVYDGWLDGTKEGVQDGIWRDGMALGRSRLGMHGARRMDGVKKHLVEPLFPFLRRPSLAGMCHGQDHIDGSLRLYE